MTPHQASGAGQAVEDAYILGEILHRVFAACAGSGSGSGSRPSPALLARAFAVYEQVRLPLANAVLATSRDNGWMYSLSYPGCRPEDLFERGADGRLRLGAGQVERMEKMLDAQWSWAWTTSVDDDRDRAMRLLDEVLASSPGS